MDKNEKEQYKKLKDEKKTRKFKERLICLLKDEDVRRCISEIFGNDTHIPDTDKYISEEEYKNAVAEKTAEISRLNTLIKDNTYRISELEKNAENKDREITEYKSVISNQKTTIGNYSNRYSGTERIYGSFLKLSDDTRSQLSGILKGESLEQFFACAGKDDFVRRFWDFISERIISQKSVSGDDEILADIFDALFDVYNSSTLNVKYIRQDVRAGEMFDWEKHTSTGNSQGEISAVLFRGYCGADGKILKKSITDVY